MNTVQISIELPREIVSAVSDNPETFVHEMRVVAAIKWYEMEKLSQSRAAEVAGISRSEFIRLLGEYGVTPFQVNADEIIEEANLG